MQEASKKCLDERTKVLVALQWNPRFHSAVNNCGINYSIIIIGN